MKALRTLTVSLIALFATAGLTRADEHAEKPADHSAEKAAGHGEEKKHDEAKTEKKADEAKHDATTEHKSH